MFGGVMKHKFSVSCHFIDRYIQGYLRVPWQFQERQTAKEVSEICVPPARHRGIQNASSSENTVDLGLRERARRSKAAFDHAQATRNKSMRVRRKEKSCLAGANEELRKSSCTRSQKARETRWYDTRTPRLIHGHRASRKSAAKTSPNQYPE